MLITVTISVWKCDSILINMRASKNWKTNLNCFFIHSPAKTANCNAYWSKGEENCNVRIELIGKGKNLICFINEKHDTKMLLTHMFATFHFAKSTLQILFLNERRFANPWLNFYLQCFELFCFLVFWVPWHKRT